MANPPLHNGMGGCDWGDGVFHVWWRKGLERFLLWIYRRKEKSQMLN